MTQEEESLLLKDLSARLPYGVKVLLDIERQFDGGSVCTLTSIKLEETPIFNVDVTLHDCSIEELRPYLRPMSSMTEKEIKEFYKIENIIPKVGYICPSQDWHFTVNGYDWLNKNHFDYRSLIEKGLAIEVTEENNPYKD